MLDWIGPCIAIGSGFAAGFLTAKWIPFTLRIERGAAPKPYPGPEVYSDSKPYTAPKTGMEVIVMTEEREARIARQIEEN